MPVLPRLPPVPLCTAAATASAASCSRKKPRAITAQHMFPSTPHSDSLGALLPSFKQDVHSRGYRRPHESVLPQARRRSCGGSCQQWQAAGGWEEGLSGECVISPLPSLWRSCLAGLGGYLLTAIRCFCNGAVPASQAGRTTKRSASEVQLARAGSGKRTSSRRSTSAPRRAASAPHLNPLVGNPASLQPAQPPHLAQQLRAQPQQYQPVQAQVHVQQAVHIAPYWPPPQPVQDGVFRSSAQAVGGRSFAQVGRCLVPESTQRKQGIKEEEEGEG